MDVPTLSVFFSNILEKLVTSILKFSHDFSIVSFMVQSLSKRKKIKNDLENKLKNLIL